MGHSFQCVCPYPKKNKRVNSPTYFLYLLEQVDNKLMLLVTKGCNLPCNYYLWQLSKVWTRFSERDHCVDAVKFVFSESARLYILAHIQFSGFRSMIIVHLDWAVHQEGPAVVSVVPDSVPGSYLIMTWCSLSTWLILNTWQGWVRFLCFTSASEQVLTVRRKDFFLTFAILGELWCMV